MAIPVGAFFEQNRWANERLLAVCEGLSDEQLDATGVGVYGSIREMLLHVLSSEQYYLERAAGVVPEERVTIDVWPGFEVLKRVAAATSSGLAEWAERLPAGAAVAGRASDGFTETLASVFFVQAFNHSTEHRTQILSVLTALGAGPEGLDDEISGWAWGEESGALKPR